MASWAGTGSRCSPVNAGEGRCRRPRPLSLIREVKGNEHGGPRRRGDRCYVSRYPEHFGKTWSFTPSLRGDGGFHRPRRQVVHGHGIGVKMSGVWNVYHMAGARGGDLHSTITMLHQLWLLSRRRIVRIVMSPGIDGDMATTFALERYGPT
jgi:hypothetical protein